MATINSSRESIPKISNKKRRSAEVQQPTIIKEKKSKPRVTRERKNKCGEPHQIFLTLKEFAISQGDKIWEEIFALAAENDLPSNMKFNKNQLSFKYKNQNHELLLEEDDTEKLYNTVKLFYQHHIGIFSPKDIENIEANIGDYYASLPKKDPRWSDLTKSEKLKVENLIKKYAIEHYYNDEPLVLDNPPKREEVIESIINAIKMKMYCGKNSDGSFELGDEVLTKVCGIVQDPRTGLYRLADCKIPKIANNSPTNCESESMSTSTGASSKKTKKNNFLKYYEKLLSIIDDSSNPGVMEVKTTTAKRQTKRKR